MTTTNLTAAELNYDHYSANKYDQDIINVIPFHKELHAEIIRYVKNRFKKSGSYDILDLGVGTALTSKLVKDALPNARFDLVDFSKRMLAGAKKRMGNQNTRYVYGDYSQMAFDKKYDIIVCVIGFHHQTTAGKKKMIKKIHSLLKPGGVFILGDLVTYRSRQKAAINQAKHLHHLVEHAVDEKSLQEWAHHHLFLNDLAPLEDHVEWLKAAGFTTKVRLNKFNTALITGIK